MVEFMFNATFRPKDRIPIYAGEALNHRINRYEMDLLRLFRQKSSSTGLKPFRSVCRTLLALELRDQLAIVAGQKRTLIC